MLAAPKSYCWLRQRVKKTNKTIYIKSHKNQWSEPSVLGICSLYHKWKFVLRIIFNIHLLSMSRHRSASDIEFILNPCYKESVKCVSACYKAKTRQEAGLLKPRARRAYKA